MVDTSISSRDIPGHSRKLSKIAPNLDVFALSNCWGGCLPCPSPTKKTVPALSCQPCGTSRGKVSWGCTFYIQSRSREYTNYWGNFWSPYCKKKCWGLPFPVGVCKVIQSIARVKISESSRGWNMVFRKSRFGYVPIHIPNFVVS